jgi:phosphate transport system substrate-binding protein
VLTRTALAGVAIAALALTGCASSEEPSDNPSSTESANPYEGLEGEIVGTGATFPDNFYQLAIENFADAAPDIAVTYTKSGSSAGRKDFASGLNDFAGTDSLVKAGQPDNPAEGDFYYIPTVAAPITVSFNLPGVDELNLTASTLAKIFSTAITSWDDAAIAAENPGADLPATPITVVHRSEGSGTTNNFTGYLTKAAASDWTLGRGDTVEWAASTSAAEGNGGVAQLIKDTEGAVGYVDFSAATDSGLTFASIKNKAGEFIAPSLDGATAAVAGATVADDLSYDPLDAAGADAYPITAPTYIIVRPSYEDGKGALVKAFVSFILNEGPSFAEEVHYAAIPEDLRDQALEVLDSVTDA